MCAPGTISNDRLFDKKDPTKIRDNLRLKHDYIGVNARVWWLFMHVHGGGQLICRQDLNIYAAECAPETDLQLAELREGASASPEILTWQFVDECMGDTQLHQEKYGDVTMGGTAAAEEVVSVAVAPVPAPAGLQEVVSVAVPSPCPAGA